MKLSLVTPVYNEVGCLAELYRRLCRVLEGMEIDRGSEMLFVDDGSDDGSAETIAELARQDPRVRLVRLGSNHGQFQAVMEGLARATGTYVITLDSDLQNPPEEIPRLLDALENGHDLVNTRREGRQDPVHRKLASRVSNRLSSWLLQTSIPDHGCMLCGFHGSLVERMCARADETPFLQALALSNARRPICLSVSHAARFSGKSRYGLWGLLKLQMTAAVAFRRARHELLRREDHPG